MAFDVLKDSLLKHTTYSHQPQLKLLAKQKWVTRVFLVFDISNTCYDPELGHLPEQNQLPV